jgi:primosomal protein N' (replication factor Y)
VNDERIARVAVDMPLPHLDRFFDYAVPAPMDAEAVPGARVRVRFAGKLRDGYLIARVTSSEHEGDLAPLQRVVSPEVVLKPEIVRVIRAVADHYAGSFADVVRLAVPPRHGLTEVAVQAAHPAPALEAEPTVIPAYPWGPEFLNALAEGRRPRAALALAPVQHRLGDWTDALIDVALTALRAGRGALLLVPDARDLARLAGRCVTVFGRGSFVTLTAESGPAARYRAFLAVSRGAVKLVLGTRAAAFAPVADLGVIGMVDDGDDSYSDPRTPYAHAREIVALRAAQQGCALLYVGHARTAEVQALAAKGWLVNLEAPPAGRRELCPLVRVAADTDVALARDPGAHSRLPHEVFTAVRAGLAAGPVLLQVPRAGYLTALACGDCRSPAACPICQHPLAAGRDSTRLLPSCRWCGPHPDWVCPDCGSGRLMAPRVGVERTAEELGKAFVQTRIVQSSGDHIVDDVPDEPAIVLATPGAEPRAADGYSAAILLDTHVLLGRAELRAGEEALRRWLAVLALVRPAVEGGTVIAVGDPSSRAVQALVRLDPVGFAQRELADRVESGFPPASKLVTIEGSPTPVGEALARLSEVAADVWGPVVFSTPSGEAHRVTLRTPLADGRRLVGAVRDVLAFRTARKEDGALRVRVDPQVLG